MASRALVAGLAAVLGLLIAGAPNVQACTPCSPTFEDLVSATHSIALVRWERREADTDVFAVVDAMRGPSLRTVRLFSEYLQGQDPHGRWILLDEGYLGLLRVDARGRITDPLDAIAGNEHPRTVSGWSTAIRHLPETSTSTLPPIVLPPQPESVQLVLLLAAGAGATVAWLRFGRRRPRPHAKSPDGRVLRDLPFLAAALLLGSCSGAATPSTKLAAEPHPALAPAAIRTAAPAPSASTTAAGDVACSSITMREHRAEAVVAPLPDGGALILGGYDDATFWDDPAHLTPTWELFDARTDTFKRGGKIPGGVWPYLTVGLADGRVLMLTSGAPLLFDPATDTFTKAGRMHRGQTYDIAVRLEDGRVLVTGGSSWDAYDYPRGAELFDPATRTWAVTGSMHTARFGAGAALLPDGRVLVAGGDMGIGEGDLNIVHSSAELYDPAASRFIGARPMHDPGTSVAALPLDDGGILITADWYGAEPPLPSEIYSATTGRFTPTGAMPWSSPVPPAQLSDGRVVVFGGASPDESDAFAEDPPPVPASSLVYDPATGTFTELRLMNPFVEFTAAALRDGRVLLVGDEDKALVCSP